MSCRKMCQKKSEIQTYGQLFTEAASSEGFKAIYGAIRFKAGYNDDAQGMSEYTDTDIKSDVGNSQRNFP